MKRYKEFFFEAAHYVVTGPSSGPQHMHGHSYRVRLTCEGEPDSKTGLLADFSYVAATINALYKELDHTTLNDVPGLENPTMENVTVWIWNKAKPSLPQLSEVAVSVDTLHEGCIYNGQ